MKYRGADIEPTGGSYNRFSWSFGPPLSSFGGAARDLDDAKRKVDTAIEEIKTGIQSVTGNPLPADYVEARRKRFFAEFPEAL
jgi:hypothetical protein